MRVPETEFLLIQPNIPRGERWSEARQELHLRRIGEYTERVLNGLAAAPDAVLWPENLLTSPVDDSSTLSAALEGWVDRLAVPIILGSARSPLSHDAERYRSSVLWMTPGGGLATSLDKSRAVPVLESANETALSRWFDGAFGRAARWKKVDEMPVSGALVGEFTVSPLLCFEALIPRIAAARRSTDSVAFVNLADDSWAEDPRATEQLVAFSRFRAIEQRLPLLRVAHGGLSVVIDEFGQIVERLPQNEYAFTVARAGPLSPPTVRERVGLLALPLFAGLGVWWLPVWRDRS